MSTNKSLRIIVILILAGIVLVINLLKLFTGPVKTGKDIELYINKECSYSDIKGYLNMNGFPVKNFAFDLLSKRKGYTENIKPGHYLVTDGISYNRLLNKLSAGNQDPVNITFNNIRTLEELAGRLGSQLMADSLEIIGFLSDEANYKPDRFIYETVMAVFLPDTYEVYWTITPEELYRRMLDEFNRYWTDSRLQKAAGLGLSPVDVSTLASIVDDEVAHEDEKPMIAGVYLNRLRKGMYLQSCPTIKFALKDFTIQRVLTEHLVVDSPYNTYKHPGLPPGPVRCATKSGIEAVLNAADHDWLYFVAKYDFSGYHHFSKTLAEHNRYANRYQAELDKRRIYK